MFISSEFNHHHHMMLLWCKNNTSHHVSSGNNKTFSQFKNYCSQYETHFYYFPRKQYNKTCHARHLPRWTTCQNLSSVDFTNVKIHKSIYICHDRTPGFSWHVLLISQVLLYVVPPILRTVLVSFKITHFYWHIWAYLT